MNTRYSPKQLWSAALTLLAFAVAVVWATMGFEAAHLVMLGLTAASVIGGSMYASWPQEPHH